MLEQIEEVSIDLWLSYKNLVKELMPSAEVVADRFHVMKQIIAFLIHKRYIPDPEQLNQQRFKCAAQMREPL